MRMISTVALFGFFSCLGIQGCGVARGPGASLSQTEFPHWIRIFSQQSTFLKSDVRQASELQSGTQKCEIPAGTFLPLKADPIPLSNGHWAVALTMERPGCQLMGGVIYGAHIQEMSIDGAAVVPAGKEFADFYSNNYDSILASRPGHLPQNSTSTASTALQKAGFPIQPTAQTAELVSQLESLGWESFPVDSLADADNLRTGDLVFTDRAVSAIPGTYSQVFVFIKPSDQPGFALVNNHEGLQKMRNLMGDAGVARAERAFRPKRSALQGVPPPVVQPVPVASAGQRFADFFDTNYNRVMSARNYQGPNACASTTSAALQLAGFPVRQVTITNDVESQLIRLNWRKIPLNGPADYAQLQPGDVVFTTKSDSNVAGTYSHVYVLIRPITADKSQWYINDNKGRNIHRYLQGDGGRSQSRSILAYRAP